MLITRSITIAEQSIDSSRQETMSICAALPENRDYREDFIRRGQVLLK